MTKEKLFVLALKTAKIIAERNIGDVKRAVDNNDILSLLTTQNIKAGLSQVNLAVPTNDTDVINHIINDPYFIDIFQTQIRTLLSGVKTF